MADLRALDRTSLAVGLVALTGAGLSLLDDSGVVAVDEAVAAASLLIAAGVAGLTRSVHRLLAGRGSRQT